MQQSRVSPRFMGAGQLNRKPVMGIEPMTSSLPRMCSTPEPHRQAEDGDRTRYPQLGRLVLYQMSYFRVVHVVLWREMDLNHRRLASTGLQPVSFDRSDIPPRPRKLTMGIEPATC